MSLSVFWKKESNGVKKNITNIVVSVTWAGSIEQASRTAEIGIPNSESDTNIKALGLKIECGDFMILKEDEKTLFNGQVTSIEKKGATESTLSYVCEDMLKNLLRSTGTYKFKNKTPEYITKMLCNSFGIKVGEIAATGLAIEKMFCEEVEIYNIIKKAYKKATKNTGQKYIIRMEALKLCVRKKGEVVNNFCLSEKVNITASAYTETIDEMINSVVIYDSRGKKTDVVKKDAQISKFGLYQGTYTKESGVNASRAAAQLLTGKTKTVSIEAVDVTTECIAGNAVKVSDTATGMTGKFLIDSDSHTWENGVHTASFELTFEKMA